MRRHDFGLLPVQLEGTLTTSSMSSSCLLVYSGEYSTINTTFIHSLHVGGARTALYNWLMAKKGQLEEPKSDAGFVVRVEDTDLARSTKGMQNISYCMII